MPDPVLVDTGPLVACFNPDDDRHADCLETFRLLKGNRLVTTLAIVTETLYLLDFSLSNQRKFLQFLSSGIIEIEEIAFEDFPMIGDLMGKYHDCPMDFGDATLVLLADCLRTRRVFTLDERDFRVYRAARSRHFEII